MEPDTTSAPREKKIRWALTIFILFVVGLALDHFFLHILFQEKLKELNLENKAKVQSIHKLFTPRSRATSAASS
jgi:hypothetical protein